MAVAGSDPRAALPPPADVEPSARPVVARPGRGLPNWAIAAGIVIAGLILFLILDARRRQLSAPATRVRTADLRNGAEPPPLYVPPVPEPAPTVIPPPPRRRHLRPHRRNRASSMSQHRRRPSRSRHRVPLRLRASARRARR